VRIVVRDRNLKEIGLGSGFFVSSDGTLVTNHHVVRNAASATVLLPSGETFSVDSILAWDEARDLAILKVVGNALPKLDLVPTDVPIPVGARVYAIGNPQGLTNTITEGLLSGTRLMNGFPYLQTSASISPGSSGGPLLDAQARVVGVTTFILAGAERVNQNLNFAVPSPAIHALVLTAATAKPVPLEVAGAKALDRSELYRALEALEERRRPEALAILKRLALGGEESPATWFARGYLYCQDESNVADGLAGKTPRNFRLAEVAYKRAIALAPDVAEFHFHLGFVYSQAHMYEVAVECDKRAIALRPDYARAYSFLGLNLTDLLRFPEAVAAHLKAISLKPLDGWSYLELGWTYRAMKHHAEAIQAARKGISLMPERARPHGYYTLALIYLDSGNRSEAIRTYETLLRLDPGLAEKLRRRIYGQ